LEIKLAIGTDGDRINLFGGLPVIVDGHVIGGIGGGSGTGEQDRGGGAAARAAVPRGQRVKPGPRAGWKKDKKKRRPRQGAKRALYRSRYVDGAAARSGRPGQGMIYESYRHAPRSDFSGSQRRAGGGDQALRQRRRADFRAGRNRP